MSISERAPQIGTNGSTERSSANSLHTVPAPDQSLHILARRYHGALVQKANNFIDPSIMGGLNPDLAQTIRDIASIEQEKLVVRRDEAENRLEIFESHDVAKGDHHEFTRTYLRRNLNRAAKAVEQNKQLLAVIPAPITK